MKGIIEVHVCLGLLALFASFWVTTLGATKVFPAISGGSKNILNTEVHPVLNTSYEPDSFTQATFISGLSATCSVSSDDFGQKENTGDEIRKAKGDESGSFSIAHRSITVGILLAKSSKILIQ